MRKLFLIPARGGSKGLPRKNILPLAGRPMIEYTLDAALGSMDDGDELCVSTDDEEIIKVVEEYGLRVPFVRPYYLSNDTASSRGVILHAIEFYKDMEFDMIIYLQPTSPFRSANHIKDCIQLFTEELDMVVSVQRSKSNPYFNLYEEDEKGYIKLSKQGSFHRRQDCPSVWELNGAVYIINVASIKMKEMNTFNKVIHYPMDPTCSLDIDTKLDWIIANCLIQKNYT